MTENCVIEKNEYFIRLCQFIEKTKTTDNFNRVASAVIPIAASEKSITCELKVDQEHVNGKRTCHGGLTATLVDISTNWAVRVSIPEASILSVDISCSFMNPIPIGTEIIIQANVLKRGRTIAFTECEFRRKDDNRILVKGQQTLSILQ